MDEAHLGKELAAAMFKCGKHFIWTRIRNREARGVLELLKIKPEQNRNAANNKRDTEEEIGTSEKRRRASGLETAEMM